MFFWDFLMMAGFTHSCVKSAGEEGKGFIRASNSKRVMQANPPVLLLL